MPLITTIPVGQDTASGNGMLPSIGPGTAPCIVGTSLPTANLQIWSRLGNTPGIEEAPPYPIIERAQQGTCQHKIDLGVNDAYYYQGILSRGLTVTDTWGQIWRILSCRSERKTHLQASLEYVMESLSFDSPPDDFDIQASTLDLNIIKHPRYSWALSPYATDASTYMMVGDKAVYFRDIKEAIIRGIQNYQESPKYPTANTLSGYYDETIGGSLKSGIIPYSYPNPNFDPTTINNGIVKNQTWDGTNAALAIMPADVQTVTLFATINLSDPAHPVSKAIAAANELLTKLWRGEDTPYIPSYIISHTQYFYHPIFLNGGCYIEDPRDVIPYYFLNPAASQYSSIARGWQAALGPVIAGSNADTSAASTGLGSPNSLTIFDALTRINPQCFSTTGIYGGPLGISSLRLADSFHYERTWFAVTHQWNVAPIGSWDRDLFTTLNRPQIATDFNQLPMFTQ